MQHFKDPQLRGGWFFYGPYCIKSLESSLLQSTLSTARGLFFSLSTVETNSSFVSPLLSNNISQAMISTIKYLFCNNIHLLFSYPCFDHCLRTFEWIKNHKFWFYLASLFPLKLKMDDVSLQFQGTVATYFH